MPYYNRIGIKLKKLVMCIVFLGVRIKTSRLALNPGLAEDEEDSETEFQQDDPLGMTTLELLSLLFDLKYLGWGGGRGSGDCGCGSKIGLEPWTSRG